MTEPHPPSTLPTVKVRAERSLVSRVTRFFESLGLLNKGSADSPATPSAEQAASTAGVNTNSLNVTRVSGLGTLVASVGAAAIAVFSVDKKTDPPAVVMAAYISVGVIVAAALVTVGIIITADIRSRVALSNAAPRENTQQAASATPTPATSPTASSVVAVWRQAVGILRGVLDDLQRQPTEVTAAWLDASASTGIVAELKPSADQQPLHAQLQAGHSHFLESLGKLLDECDATKRDAALASLRKLVDLMDRALRARV
jgi:hypothetical protein